ELRAPEHVAVGLSRRREAEPPGLQERLVEPGFRLEREQRQAGALAFAVRDDRANAPRRGGVRVLEDTRQPDPDPGGLGERAPGNAGLEVVALALRVLDGLGARDLLAVDFDEPRELARIAGIDVDPVGLASRGHLHSPGEVIF